MPRAKLPRLRLPKLPAELWLVIFDLIIGPTLDPVGMCNFNNFPETSLHLRLPREHGPIEDPHTQLRLVCRAFRSLIGPSPYFFVINVNNPIPTTARAVYTPLHEAPSGYLTRVLVDPYRSRRIVTLYLTCTKTYDQIVPFDDLCECTHGLATLRNLTLSIFYLHHIPLKIRLWSRIGKAFPLLVSFVLRPALKRLDGVPMRTMDETSSIVFERLEILDAGCFVVSPFLRFPALRHAAYSRCARRDIDILANSPLLESLLLRGIDYGQRIDLSPLPQLLSLGIPKTTEALSLPPVDNHPLYHMCIYMVSERSFYGIIPWVESLPTHYPVISRITIDLSQLERVDHAWVRRYFMNAELKYSGLAVFEFTAKGKLVVIGRIPVVPRPVPVAPIEAVVPNAEPGPSSEPIAGTGPVSPPSDLVLSGSVPPTSEPAHGTEPVPPPSEPVPSGSQPRPATRGKRLKKGLEKVFRKLRL